MEEVRGSDNEPSVRLCALGRQQLVLALVRLRDMEQVTLVT